MFAKIAMIFMIFLSLCSCSSGERGLSYYLSNTGKQKPVLKDLFALLNKEGNTADSEFSVVREIANQYRRLNDDNKMINLLSERVNRHPDDPYNSYYLLRIADCYMRQDSKPISALYFGLVIKNYPDLIVRGESIHLACLKQLILLSDDPEQTERYYEKLTSQFADKIDLASAYFMLGQAEEKIGNWEKAIEVYKKFVPFYGTIIQGFPDAYSYAKQMVDFYNTKNNYQGSSGKYERTFSTLSALINRVKTSLDNGDTLSLWNVRARVNFFARTWSQIGSIEDESTKFNYSSLYTSGRINYNSDLSTGSGSNDVYLKTWGWSKLAPTWYFYFRKIYFPIDPDLHGRWEWAGIYYGERF